MRREDTARTPVKVVEPLVRNMRVTQVLDPYHLLPGAFGVKCILQTLSSVRQPRKLRGTLSRLFRGGRDVSSESSSSSVAFSSPSRASRLMVAASITTARRGHLVWFREKSGCDCILSRSQDTRFGCNECSQVCRSRNVSRPFFSFSGLACAECGTKLSSVNPGKSLSRDLCLSSS